MDALLAEAVARHRAGDVAAAAAAARRVLEREPENASALYLLGLAHLRGGRPAEALPPLAAAAAARPDRADAQRALGDAAGALGRTGEALAAYRRVLDLRPDDADLWIAIGGVLRRADRGSEALVAYTRALTVRPHDPVALHNRGTVHRQLGRLPAAIADYEHALSVRPDDRETLGNLVNAFRAAGRHDEAVLTSRRILRLDPDDVAGLYGLGAALHACGRWAEAVVPLERALRLQPGHVDAANALGAALLAMDRPAEALACFDAAAAADPAHVISMVNRGAALEALDRDREAADSYGRAVSAAPKLAAAHFNLGNALAALGRQEEAEAAFDRAIAIDPDDAQFHYNRAHARLAQGRLEDGWEDFAFVWHERRMRRRPYPQPLWDGTATTGRLVIWGEQGIGDEILASGLLADAAARTGGLVVECDPRLVPLLRRSFPAPTLVPRVPDPDAAGLAPDIAFQAPMVYLPVLLRRRWEDFAEHPGYLAPDPACTEALRAAYRTKGGRLVVGISWRSANARLGRRKSLGLDGWGPILRTPGVTFVDLQYGSDGAETAAAAAATGAEILHDPAIDPLTDIDGFAAQVAAMDLVVTVSNSTAHLAGALGRPCRVLLPHGRGLLWYWLMCRGDRSPWYPSLRLHRQRDDGDWAPAIREVATALAGS
ncbi:MAG: tetratricopeptide repeat protein [Alphaproteobacteria bacterium]